MGITRLLILIFLFTAPAALAQDVGQVPDETKSESKEKEPPRAEIKLHFRDYDSDIPIQGVDIQVAEVGGKGRWKGISDDAGRWSCEEVPAGAEVQVITKHPVFASRRQFIHVRSEMFSERVYLIRAVTIRGKLHDVPEDTSNVRIRLMPVAESETALLLEGDGYRFPILSDGRFGPFRICRGQYTAILQSQGVELCEWPLHIENGPTPNLIELRRPQGPGVISGMVLDEAGVPRRNARVRLVPLSQGVRVLAFSEPDGSFKFENVAYGSYRVQLVREVSRNYFDAEQLVLHTRSKGVFWGAKKIEISEETPEQSLHFGYDPSSVNMTGILRREGIPVSGWRVLVEDLEGDDLWLSEYSRPDGMFEIPGLTPEKQYRILYETSTAWVPGGKLTVGSDEREVHWLEVPDRSVSGQIFISGTRFTPEKGEVILQPKGGGDERWLGWLSPDGTFELPSVTAGTYELWIHADGCREMQQELIVPEEEMILDLVLTVAAERSE